MVADTGRNWGFLVDGPQSAAPRVVGEPRILLWLGSTIARRVSLLVALAGSSHGCVPARSRMVLDRNDHLARMLPAGPGGAGGQSRLGQDQLVDGFSLGRTRVSDARKSG